MFKKTMKFDDLDGNPVEQTFYFNYNKKEIAELLEFGQVMKFAKPGDVRDPLEVQMQKLSTPVEESGLSNQENNQQAYNIFQNLILDAYGRKGDDNVTFDKNWDLRNYWESHVAFPEMIFEFLENERLAAEFIEKCLPPRMVDAARQELISKGGTDGSLVAMVQEADRRQKDPATRIEPGPAAAAAALGDNTEVAQPAQSVKAAPEWTSKAVKDLTEDDIAKMPQDEFEKLDVQKLSKKLMFAAFKRKSQG